MIAAPHTLQTNDNVLQKKSFKALSMTLFFATISEMGVIGYNCNMLKQIVNLAKMKFIFSINHQPLNYCLMSKIRITNNYKTVLKYCQNEFVVYINFIFFNPHELVVIPLRFFQDNWQTTAQEICYISQHFDRTGFQKNLYIVRFYFFLFHSFVIENCYIVIHAFNIY